MIDFIISINKISLFAFLAILGYLIYEFYLLKKEQKIKKIPKVPQFKENLAPKLSNTATVIISKNEEVTHFKKDSLIFFILLILLPIVGFLTVIGFFFQPNINKKTQELITPIPTVIERVVESGGILIYDENFKLLDKDDLSKLSSEAALIIGIKTISQVDIDKARIRVNKNFWEITDETKKFDKKNQIFYINYKIASDAQNLKIEAQLHSKTEGWLGE